MYFDDLHVGFVFETESRSLSEDEIIASNIANQERKEARQRLEEARIEKRREMVDGFRTFYVRHILSGRVWFVDKLELNIPVR